MARDIPSLGKQLVALLHRADAPRDRAAALQDSLDLVALVAGEKEMALIGCGYAAGGFLSSIADLAAEYGLAVARRGMPLVVAEEIADLPDWYRDPMLAAWRAAEILTLCRSSLPADGQPRLVDSDEEARLLSYPACCVADHHANRRRYHELMVELIAASRDSVAERRRFAAAQLLPPLRDASDRRRLAAALRASLAPLTGIAMCPFCAARYPRGAAGERTARYRALARASGLDVLLVPDIEPALLGA